MTLMTPMWQRIARGEVDLSQYSDDEILSGQIRMADGRLLPKPDTFPDTFVEEQARRGFRKIMTRMRDGAILSVEALTEIVGSPLSEDKDRIAAAKIFLDRFLGPPEKRLHITHENTSDPRDLLIQKLMAVKGISQDEEEIFEAEIVDEEDLI